MENQETNTGITKSINRTKVTVDEIVSSPFKKYDDGTPLQQAQVRQIITVNTTYPAVSVGNSEQSPLFNTSELGLKKGKTYSTTNNRLDWIAVPKGTTIAEIQAKLDSLPNACIYRKISHHPTDVMTQQQIADVANDTNDRDLEYYAEKSVIRYPEGTANEDGVDISGLEILKNGNMQYQNFFFSDVAKDDVDSRNEENVYNLDEVLEQAENNIG